MRLPSIIRLLGIVWLLLAAGACKKEESNTPSTPDIPPVEVTSVSLSVTELTLEKGKTAQLTAMVLPSDATDPTIAWTSSESSVATVSQTGFVTAVSEGTTTISAKVANKTASCLVTVSIPYVAVQSVTLDHAYVVLGIGESLSLSAEVLPKDATSRSVSWSSDNKDAVSVSATGLLTGIAEGTAVITAEADGVKSSCRVQVLPPAPAANQIEYTSTGGVVVEPYDSEAFGAKIVSNTYQNGRGVIEFDGPVTQIGEKAFYQRDKLIGIYLPAGVTKIGAYAFYYTSLMRITMQNKVAEIGNYAFGWCTTLRTISLSGSLAKIGSSAFQSCSALNQVVLPEGIQEIKSSAFASCVSMQSLQINAITPPTLGSRALENTADCPIYVPAAAVNSYKSATGWRSYEARIRAIL